MVKKSLKSLSFHPHLAAIVDIFFGGLLVWWFVNIKLWSLVIAWFLVRIVWWLVLARFVYYSKGIRRHLHIFSLITFQIGTLCWLIFIDRGTWTWISVLLGTILLPSLSFWLLPVTQNDLSFVGKPQRRFRLFLTVLGIAGLWTGVGAFITHNIFAVPIFVWISSVAGFTAGTSIIWWKEYGVYDRKLLILWSVAMWVFVLEYAWVIELWPIHYFLSGLLITWLWYIVWLIARFRLSPEGIQWKKQLFFLSGNAILITIFLLLLVKWK